ncbi:HipA family kinase [Eggerthella timonensis]|uniref:HipA family kinase n=1 Tax=Eggerthella timonensis TaxID=1871008 RepID=UPI000C78CE76|nr:HipA family kinase [Eggerthella timonensis]
MNETRTYLLRLYDDDLASFTLARDERGAVRCVGAECDESRRGLLPFRMSGDAASFERWIEGRTISKNRTFASRIVRQYGIRFDDAMQMLDACNGLSLNDAYWVVPEGSAATFAERNLYENPFDELVATVAFSGVLDTSKEPEGLSGELTTSGQFPKAWRIVGGERFLYKAGAPSSNGLEPHAEYYAAQLAEAMDIPHASYDLATWHGELCSASPLFTSYDIGFATFSGMFGTLPFEDIADAYAEHGPEARERFAAMTVFDALIANDDRHLGNFGFLFDNRTRAVVSAAPVFDNNLGLFIRDVDAGLTASDLARSAAWYKSPSNVLLDYQARYAMTDDLQDRLAALRGFEFAPHPDLPLDERYTALLNDYIGLRIEALLTLR